MLDPEIRAELRSLSKNLAEVVGRHWPRGMLMDEDPELAWSTPATSGQSRPNRIVREAVGLTAYTQANGRSAVRMRPLVGFARSRSHRRHGGL